MIKKIKDNKELIYNIAGGVAVLLLAGGVDLSQTNTWTELAVGIKDIFTSPATMFLSIVAVKGYVTNLKSGKSTKEAFEIAKGKIDEPRELEKGETIQEPEELFFEETPEPREEN